MSRVLILVPVLDRPHRVAPLLASINRSRAPAHDVDVLFLASPRDEAERQAVVDVGARCVVVSWPPGRGDFARKQNHGFRLACREGYDWAFLGADDLEFRPFWLERALAAHGRRGACWIGTNDTVNERVKAGRHATHSLVHRDYLECGTIDEPGKILCEKYGHWFVDDESVQTAMMRGTWAFARDSHVVHLHPLYGRAVDDETYRKGQASVFEDKALFESRAPLWNRAMSR